MTEFTGERFILGMGSAEIHHEHRHRYEFAAILAGGSDVLDLGCGSGYGSMLLAAAGANVQAIDIDPVSVEAAQTAYGSAARFTSASAYDVPFDDANFDVVTCFEVIEHVDEPQRVIDEAARVLRPSGVLIISTPMKAEYNRGLLNPNPFHVHEMEHDEFAPLVARQFPFQRVLRQRSFTVSALWEADIDDSALALVGSPASESLARLAPVYEVIVASRNPLSATLRPSLFLDIDVQRGDEPDLVRQVRRARLQLAEWEDLVETRTQAWLAAEAAFEDLQARMNARPSPPPEAP